MSTINVQTFLNQGGQILVDFDHGVGTIEKTPTDDYTIFNSAGETKALTFKELCTPIDTFCHHLRQVLGGAVITRIDGGHKGYGKTVQQLLDSGNPILVTSTEARYHFFKDDEGEYRYDRNGVNEAIPSGFLCMPVTTLRRTLKTLLGSDITPSYPTI